MEPRIARHLPRLANPLALLQFERARWFLWSPVCFAAGIAIYFALPFEPHLAVVALGTVIAAAVHCSHRWAMGALPLTAAFLLVAAGGLASSVRTMWVASPILERTIYAASVQGVVEYVQPRPSRGPRVSIAVISIQRLAPERTPHKIRVRFQARLPTLMPGQMLSFKATLSPPAAPALPGGYDFGRAAYYQSLGAVGFAIGKPTIKPSPTDQKLPAKLSAAVQSWRQQIGLRIMAALPGQTGAIANALMTGERGLIERATLEAYRDAGLLHLLSISGLHMAIMAGSVFFALRLLLSCIETAALRYPIKKWAALGAILAAFAYLQISGSTHATIRAFVMVTIIMVAIMLDRPGLALRNLALAAMAILVVSPESLLHVGFQMSFAAVIALIATYEYLQDRRSKESSARHTGWSRTTILFLFGIVGSTIIASIAVAPIAAFHFHKSQQYAVLANLIAVPVCNLLVMPSALLAFILMPFGLEALPLTIMGKGIELMTWCAQTVAALPGAVSRVPAFSTLSFGLMIFGGLWVCLWQRPWRWFGIVIIAIGIARAPYLERPDLLAGRDGRLIALRQSDGHYAIIQNRRAKFELERWLAHDGDNRSAKDISNRAGFRCDRDGCTSRLNGKQVAVSRHAISLRADCRRSAILILPYPEPAGCATNDAMVWDFWDLRRKGTHAYYAGSGNQAHVKTVAESRGNRPWSQAHFRQRPKRWRNREPGRGGGTRLKNFAAAQRLQSDINAVERPENEADDFAFDRF